MSRVRLNPNLKPSVAMFRYARSGQSMEHRIAYKTNDVVVSTRMSTKFTKIAPLSRHRK